MAYLLQRDLECRSHIVDYEPPMRLTQMGAKIALGFKLTDEERANLP